MTDKNSNISRYVCLYMSLYVGDGDSLCTVSPFLGHDSGFASNMIVECSVGKFLILLMIGGFTYLILSDKGSSFASNRLSAGEIKHVEKGESNLEGFGESVQGFLCGFLQMKLIMLVPNLIKTSYLPSQNRYLGKQRLRRHSSMLGLPIANTRWAISSFCL